MKFRLSHQINDHYCGPAAAVTVLRAFGIRATQRTIARIAHTNKKVGTSTKNLVFALRSFGLTVEARNKYSVRDLQRAFKEGEATIVCYTEPKQHEGHYAVLAGFRGENILLLSPDELGYGPISMPIKEFESRWKDPLFTKTIRWAAFVH